MDFITAILGYAKTNGVPTTILLLLLGILIIILLKGRHVHKRILNAFSVLIGTSKIAADTPKYSSTMSCTQAQLTSHQMFIYLQKYINYEIQHFSLADPLREALFKDLLLFKFKCIYKHFDTFLNRGDLLRMSDTLYRERISECVLEIIESYERKSREEGIPEIVLQKFNEWHKERIDAVHSYIIQVCDDDLFKDNIIKTRVIFDFVAHINNFALLDAKRSLVHLNGELSKLSYKGIRGSHYVPPIGRPKQIIEVMNEQ